MRQIEYSKAFKKDFKRQLKGRYKQELEEKLFTALESLICDQPLPIQYKDHELIGNWRGFRECHIWPDLLLIYRKIDSDVLQLARLGSHSNLFG